MEIKVNLGERKRKELAQAVGEIIGAEAVYKGAPSYAYEVGRATITRDGTVELDTKDEALLEKLLEGLRDGGFEPWAENISEETEEATGLIIRLPLDGFTETTLENLRLLVASKSLLIKKSMGVCDLTIRKSEETVDFPWFDDIPSVEEIKAYTHFLTLLCDMAKRQSRVLATEKPVENEKYAFRCFLLRLGMKGEEYAETRRILLRNLSGNGSMKSGERKPPKEKTDTAPETPPEPTLPQEPETTSPKKQRFSWKKLFIGLKMMGIN